VTLSVVIENPAREDLAAAVQWYKQVQPGLEADFRLCVPGRRLRQALIERIPFAIFYLRDADAIHVFGVLHTSRSPRLWQARND
jgi:hypothetical protein